MRTLALVPGGVSDQILFFPTLSALKQTYPQARLDVVAEPRSVGAYRVCPSVDQVIPFDFQSSNNSLADWGNLLGAMRERQYEAVITLTSSWGMGLLLWLTGIPERVSYEGDADFFMTHSIPQPLASDKVDRYLPTTYQELLKPLGVQGNSPDLSVSIPRKDLEWVEGERKRLGLTKGFVLVDSSCESRRKTQRYPGQSWQQVLKVLSDRQPDLPIVVLQWPEETELLGELREMGVEFKTIVAPDIGKLAATVGSASLLLSTSMASMQLAVAVQTFTIGLFGADNPKRLVPQSTKFMGIQPPSGKVADIAPQQIIDAIV